MTIYTLDQIYAGAGSLPLVTLEINNSSLGALRFVLAYEDMTLGGQLYTASAFTAQMPARTDSGFSDLSFGVCGVSGEVFRYLTAVIAAGTKTAVTLSQWRPDPPRDRLYVLTLTMTGGQITREACTFTAGFGDMVNLAFPRKRYTAEFAPGLKYVAG